MVRNDLTNLLPDSAIFGFIKFYKVFTTNPEQFTFFKANYFKFGWPVG